MILTLIIKVISLFEAAFSHWWVVVWQDTLHIIGPVALLGFDYQLPRPTFPILGWTEDHLDGGTLAAVGLQLSYLWMNRKIDARL